MFIVDIVSRRCNPESVLPCKNLSQSEGAFHCDFCWGFSLYCKNVKQKIFGPLDKHTSMQTVPVMELLFEKVLYSSLVKTLQ